MKRVAAILALALWVGSVAATAQGQAPVDQLLSCGAITDNVARLRCFDAARSALKSAIEARDVVIVSRSEAQETRRSLFGFSLPRIGLFGGGDKRGPPPRFEDVTRVESVISRVRPGGGYGLYLLTLEDGAIWQTLEANRNFFPASGQSIAIERGLIGNYNAKIARGKAFRVKRVG
ncbi:MAG: hypothetical protein AVDCRST_MAG91-720 [uncultured Sphingomonadaceae bacterium]|uniref:Uncharacterized protein n=1 Tax=uncultured Sphingomonadaceae bacterium TaxID=169976 RepID=A0A6J4SK92_9SPHN|nr:MAG: hypothetical protein AVDCRST_MAG91-720 [uncultured Sphingomonadaceae bacterium]